MITITQCTLLHSCYTVLPFSSDLTVWSIPELLFCSMCAACHYLSYARDDVVARFLHQYHNHSNGNLLVYRLLKLPTPRSAHHSSQHDVNLRLLYTPTYSATGQLFIFYTIKVKPLQS
jgi:hypothetical protein